MGTQAQEALAKKSLENGNRMLELAGTATRVSNQQQAYWQIFNAAAETGDEEGMAKARQTLHDLVDELCDCGSQIGFGLREANRIRKEYEKLI